MTMKLAVLLLGFAVALTHGVSVKHSRKFPEDFIFGASTAAYQIEGGWDADDDLSNGDVACDSYHNYKRDVEMVRELGLPYYRISLAWSRILPNGLADKVSEAGIAYYHNLLDEMLKYNITPLVTIYHWDLPQKLQEMGGFLNPLIADWYYDYARVVFENFGDKVKNFITFNEGAQICYEGYGSVTKAPRLNLTGIGEYICAKNLAIAHARAWHMYNEEFRPKQGGVCGYTIAIGSSSPLTDSAEDDLAVELFGQSEWAIYTDPIFSKDGGFPKELLERVAAKSEAQGFPRSRLIDFTEEEKAYIRGTSDFFGVNHYTGTYISHSLYHNQHPVPSSRDDIEIGTATSPDWPQGASPWLKQMPDSLLIVLRKIQKRYGDSWPIYVTESGWSTREGLVDDSRVTYYRAALESVLDALDEGINVKGYYAWSLMDNFEWLAGYSERFGLYEVDFNDPARTRTPRKAAFVYKHIVKTRSIDYGYEPENYIMTIDEGH